ncbi:hypothetical protein [Campylobacter magnus]|uniref:hypothetical protein n=1 Tax=Campylobacter magnus TaxID=3026462 RepID=UPI00235E4AFD|nr:hypothetical protein [Campylobacter magnus]MDD0855692.1 hypothetical protein [Campylobacter magnus]
MSLAKNEPLRPNGLSLKQVGRKLGYSETQILVIQKEALAKMANILKAGGIKSPADLGVL